MMHAPLGLAGRLALIVAAIGVLSGCESAKEAFGLNKSSPDEFAVVTRAPLAIPPEFRLRPPAPGAQRLQEATTTQAAREILVRNAARPATAGGPPGLSQGESALLRQAGALNANPLVRNEVDRETTALVSADRTLVDRLIFWQKAQEPGEVIDPERESRRLRENAALGQPVTSGQTPTIERRRRALLEGIFN